MVKKSKAKAERSRVMASSSLFLVNSTHKQHKQKLVAIDGVVITVAPFVVTSLAPFLLTLGSKFSMNKK